LIISDIYLKKKKKGGREGGRDGGREGGREKEPPNSHSYNETKRRRRRRKGAIAKIA
jgi:hypothetical protein